MRLRRIGVDHYVIDVNYYKDIEVRPERSIDIAMQGSQCIRYVEQHNRILVVIVASAESCLPLLSFGDSDPMVDVTDD